MSNSRQLITQDKILVLGMGKTGLSCVRFLLGLDGADIQASDVMVCDSRKTPPALTEIQALLPAEAILTGTFDAKLLSACRQLVLSPGVSLQDQAVQAALACGVEVLGDVELFVRHATAPIIAITGSNGKSTVTALVVAMLKQAGIVVRVGANFGTPALDLLTDAGRDTSPDVFVLELSSFQLETTSSLDAVASVVLNISPDHMDRYVDVKAYRAAKQRVWGGKGVVVVNRDEPDLFADVPASRRQIGFSLGQPEAEDYGLRLQDGQYWLARGETCLLPVAALRLVGRHNVANALAALALVEALQASPAAKALAIARPALMQALADFRGLKHRMEWLAESGGVSWYNDSKGTNVGATLAALQGLDSPVVLIAGGQAKDADFSALVPVLAAKGRALVLIGQDTAQIEAHLGTVVPCLHAADMKQAVALAATQAKPGDVVLLSPACASFDMFDGYEQRGQAFAAAVRALVS